MSWLNGDRVPAPGARTYWVVALAMTTGRNTPNPRTTTVTWQADTHAELASQLAMVPNRPDLELLGVYRHHLVVEQVDHHPSQVVGTPEKPLANGCEAGTPTCVCDLG